MPLFSNKPNRGPYHRFFTTLNLLNASVFAFFVTELSLRRQTFMRFDELENYGWGNIIFDFFTAVVFQSVAEYYWHRLMHSKVFYSRLHKHHHFYKSPEVTLHFCVFCSIVDAVYYCALRSGMICTSILSKP